MHSAENEVARAEGTETKRSLCMILSGEVEGDRGGRSRQEARRWALNPACVWGSL